MSCPVAVILWSFGHQNKILVCVNIPGKLILIIFPSQEVNWWTGVVLWIVVMFYQLFGLSFWRHPFTAEDPLESDVMQFFSKSVLMKKQTNLGQNEVKGLLHPKRKIVINHFTPMSFQTR